jgi:hypothetical protein
MTNFQAIASTFASLTSAQIVISPEDCYAVVDKEVIEGSCYLNKINTIVIDLIELSQLAELISIDKEKLFEWILLHEIGHSLDPSLLDNVAKTQRLESQEKWDEASEQVFLREVTAWRIVDSLGNYSSNKEYRVLRAFALDGYLEGNTEWITKYCPDYFS